MIQTQSNSWVQLFSALLTPLVAIVALLIAWRQAQIANEQLRVNKGKLKLDLFERRYKVYATTRDFLMALLRHADLKEEDRVAFITLTAEADFLFSPQISNYLEEVHKKGLDLWAARRDMADPPNEDARIQAVKLQHQTLLWVNNQVPLLKDKFKSFISLENL